MIHSLLGLLALAAAAPPAREEAAVNNLVDQFVAAQQSFDAVALARLTAPDYVEISPLGDVDPRQRMLGFYTPDKKQSPPDVVLSERSVRLFDRTAIATTRQAYRTVVLRVVYIARRSPAGWRLVSAQFTPVRPARAP